MRHLIRRGRPSPLEYADMMVEPVNSRDMIAELTLHMLASFCIIRESNLKTALYRHFANSRVGKARLFLDFFQPPRYVEDRLARPKLNLQGVASGGQEDVRREYTAPQAEAVRNGIGGQ